MFFPSDRRNAVVIPISESGTNATNSSNYHAIALKSYICTSSPTNFSQTCNVDLGLDETYLNTSLYLKHLLFIYFDFHKR